MRITILGSDAMNSVSGNMYKERKGCRAIIEQDGYILFSCLSKRNQFLLPGGKQDPGESLEECVRRECREEQGMLIQPENWLCSIEDTYAKTKFLNDYFVVKVLQQGLPVEFVEEEISLGLVPRWLPKQGLIQWLVNTPVDASAVKEDNRKVVLNSHFREACALSVYFGEPLPMVPLHLKETISSIDMKP